MGSEDNRRLLMFTYEMCPFCKQSGPSNYGPGAGCACGVVVVVVVVVVVCAIILSVVGTKVQIIIKVQFAAIMLLCTSSK